jgi:hypothetical protein
MKHSNAILRKIKSFVRIRFCKLRKLHKLHLQYCSTYDNDKMNDWR